MSYGLVRRWSAAARSAVVLRAPQTPRRTFKAGDLERGWLVRDNQGHPLGRLARLDDTWLIVSRGLVSRLVVPRTTIGEIHEGVVVLNVSAAWITTRDRGSPGPRGWRLR